MTAYVPGLVQGLQYNCGVFTLYSSWPLTFLAWYRHFNINVAGLHYIGHDRLCSWLGTGTSIKSGGVTLYSSWPLTFLAWHRHFNKNVVRLLYIACISNIRNIWIYSFKQVNSFRLCSFRWEEHFGKVMKRNNSTKSTKQTTVSELKYWTKQHTLLKIQVLIRQLQQCGRALTRWCTQPPNSWKYKYKFQRPFVVVYVIFCVCLRIVVSNTYQLYE
jgi:hypothetical protein